MLMQEPVFPEHPKLFEIKKISSSEMFTLPEENKWKILYIETSLQRRLAIRTPKVCVQKYT